MLFQPFRRLHGHKGVLASQLDHTLVITVFRNLSADERMAKAPQLEAVEIADESVHQLWPGARMRPDAMKRQLLQDALTVAIFAQRGARPRHAGRSRYASASTISGGFPDRLPHRFNNA